MNKRLIKDGFGWGFVLWLVGYILGIVLFMVIPHPLIGWAIMPVGIIIAWVLLMKRIKGKTFDHYLKIAVIWTAIAVICDYFLLVKVFKPEDGYYKLDVYIYYTVTFLLPLLAARQKRLKINE